MRLVALLLLSWTVGLGGPLPLASGQAADEKVVKELKSDSRAPYVHRLTLYDHDGKAIDPKDPAAPPYSPRRTCGKCHSYAEIAEGWHFSAPHAGVAPGRPGEAWWLVDAQTGTVLPLSGRAWPGTYRPADVGLSAWQFVKRFGHHLPGGGFGEPDEPAVKASPEKLRWGISGRLEIDCMFCHSAGQQHDPAEAARQIEAENLKWAPTAALGLAVVRGEARKAPDDWDPEMPPDPDHPERAGPKVFWDKSRFDPDDRVLFQITRRPPNDRCYFCHSFREVGVHKPEDLVTSRDVHLAAGLLCVDCHRNETNHEMARGYATEAAERGRPWLAVFSCAGCHLGTDGDLSETAQETARDDEDEEAADAMVRMGGRYGAPHPLHRGLPPVHFEKLSCTACHSGPWPDMDARQFQTALAHGLGLATREREDTDPPVMVGPIFAKQPDGKVAPQRMAWPAFWGRLVDNRVMPLAPDAVKKAAAKLLPKSSGPPSALTPDVIGKVLEALAAQQGVPGEPVYLRAGQAFGRTPNGSLTVTPARVPGPYRWSLAHDVRPASQSLGIRGCTDCHADDAPFYFGRVAAAGQTDVPASQPMVVFRGDEEGLARLWSLGFKFRLEFKVLGFACAAVIALILLRHAMVGFLGEGSLRRDFAWYEHVFHVVALVGIVSQAVTGFIGEFAFGALREWLLLVHMVGAPLFVVGMTGTALHWAPRCRFGRAGGGLSSVQKSLFWITLVAGFIVLVTMLAAMLPLFGYADQQALAAAHGNVGLVFVIATVLLIFATLAARRRPKEVRQP